MHVSVEEEIRWSKVTVSNMKMLQPHKNTDKLFHPTRYCSLADRLLSNDVMVKTPLCTLQEDAFRAVEVAEDYVLMPLPVLYEEVEYSALLEDAFSAVLFHL